MTIDDLVAHIGRKVRILDDDELRSEYAANRQLQDVTSIAVRFACVLEADRRNLPLRRDRGSVVVGELLAGMEGF